MLIFDTTRVLLHHFKAPSVTQIYWEQCQQRELAPVQLRGTFPIPGTKTATDIHGIRFGAEYIEFPGEGEYYFYSDFGAFKCLILPPSDSELNQAKKTFAFVSKNIVHSLADLWLCRPNGFLGGGLYWDSLVEKLFFSDQPLNLWCGEAASFLATVLHERGMVCRIVSMGGKERGHILPEVWAADEKRWIMLDPDWGLCVADSRGKLLSVDDIVSRLEASPSSANDGGRG